MPRKKKAKPSDAETATMGEAVRNFVTLRDKIRNLERLHKERMMPLRKTLDGFSVEMLKLLEASGVNSMASDDGTAYRTTKTTAVLEDPDAFIKFVEETGNLGLLDRKANASAVQEYIEDNDELPPGVKLNRFISVGVRKS